MSQNIFEIPDTYLFTKKVVKSNLSFFFWNFPKKWQTQLYFASSRRSSASSEIEAGLNRSTQWQVSQFASIPRRSSCYRPSEFNQQSPNSPTPEVVVTSGWTPKSLRAKSCPRNPRGRSLGMYAGWMNEPEINHGNNTIGI